MEKIHTHKNPFTGNKWERTSGRATEEGYNNYHIYRVYIQLVAAVEKSFRRSVSILKYLRVENAVSTFFPEKAGLTSRCITDTADRYST